MTSATEFDFSNLAVESYRPSEKTSGPAVPVSDVPQVVRDQVEEAVEFFAKAENDGALLRISFPSAAARERYFAMVQAYAASRTGKANSGPWIATASRGQKGANGEGLLRYRLTRKDKYDAKRADAARIREAAKAANEANAQAQG